MRTAEEIPCFETRSIAHASWSQALQCLANTRDPPAHLRCTRAARKHTRRGSQRSPAPSTKSVAAHSHCAREVPFCCDLRDCSLHREVRQPVVLRTHDLMKGVRSRPDTLPQLRRRGPAQLHMSFSFSSGVLHKRATQTPRGWPWGSELALLKKNESFSTSSDTFTTDGSVPRSFSPVFLPEVDQADPFRSVLSV